MWFEISTFQEYNSLEKLILLYLKNHQDCVRIKILIMNSKGIILSMLLSFFSCIISNIIITKRNNIAIAPMYIMIIIKERNSKPNVIKNPALCKNTTTIQKIE